MFGKVLGSLGYTQHDYANLLFPGLLALTAVITAMQTLAFPLVAEFGWTKEIEDRLLAPVVGRFQLTTPARMQRENRSYSSRQSLSSPAHRPKAV